MKRTGHRTRVGLVLAGAAVLAAVLAACNSLLDVTPTSLIPATTLESPKNAVLLTNGAIADFDCALGSYIVVGGELTDEFEDATLTAARWFYDRRNVPSDGSELYAAADCDDEGTYIPTNRARESADNVMRIVSGASQDQLPTGLNKDSLMSVLAAYAGYSRVLLGEMFCSSVISTVLPDGSIQYGTELTPQQMFASADSAFTEAISEAQTSGNDTTLYMAYVGRARTLLDLGQYDAAKADAQQVPDGFVYYSTASTITPRRTNRVWSESNGTSVASSVGPRYQNMKYDGVADPRVTAADKGTQNAAGLEEWYQTKYPSGGASIAVAKWSEAQLIIAEADVRDGDLSDAVDIINTLHDRAGLPHYIGPEDDVDSVMAQVVDERSRELFLEGQRLGDVIRLNLTIEPAAGTPFRNGGTYGPSGNQLCLKLPDTERQYNPNLNH